MRTLRQGPCGAAGLVCTQLPAPGLTFTSCWRPSGRGPPSTAHPAAASDRPCRRPSVAEEKDLARSRF